MNGLRGLVYLRTLLPLVTFFLVFAFCYSATLQPGTLAVSAAPCGDDWCISHVFPPGQGWSAGIRKGDIVSHVNGWPIEDVAHPVDWPSVRSVTVISTTGTVLETHIPQGAIGMPPLSWSLWTVAATFAVLGTLVWSRRPDLASGVWFGYMAAVTTTALAVAPAAGGTQMEWALVIQWISVTLLGPTLLAFVLSLVGDQGYPPSRLALAKPTLFSVSFALIASYLAALVFDPSFYGVLTSAVFLMLAISLIGSVALLLYVVLRKPSGAAADVLRIPLAGLALGTLPFTATILLPSALGREQLLPPHLAVLPVALIPASFAYTILRSQLWGIRRLIHRGLVNLLLSILVFTLVALAIVSTDRVLRAESDRMPVEVAFLAVILLIGIYFYHPMRSLVRKAVDNLVYGGAVSYPEFIQGLQRDITHADAEGDIHKTVTRAFAELLKLESVLLLREDDDGRLRVTAMDGERAEDVLNAISSGQVNPIMSGRSEGPIVLPYGAEQLVAMQLWTTETLVGVLLVGPKLGGELFLRDEISLIVNTAPFIATALDRHDLSRTMRQLNRRLVETEERSRYNIAIDLHDGPLQKAVTLAIGRVQDPAEQREVATELVNELREIGSRLRPSMLDDLGLPASLDWLLEHNLRGSNIAGSLTLVGMDEDTRLEPDVELALFRITQEAINNAVKHSHASELHVTLTREDEQITLTIRDNGVGVADVGSNPLASSRLGLVGMRERAMQVGGHLEMHSRAGEGVFVQVTVPLQPSVQD